MEMECGTAYIITTDDGTGYRDITLTTHTGWLAGRIGLATLISFVQQQYTTPPQHHHYYIPTSSWQTLPPEMDDEDLGFGEEWT